MDILSHNREAWTKEVAEGNKWTIPVAHEVVEAARRGEWALLLTPTKSVPRGWFGEISGKKVLCLASGGGQQGPVLAAAGAKVTVFDNCPAQLDRDREVAGREGLDIALEQGDMRDLGRFSDAAFDLIFHPVSNVFVDDARSVWKECFRVLKSGGILLAGFANPLLYIFDLEAYDESGVREVKYRIPYSDLDQLPKEVLAKRLADKQALEWGHSLADLIGGQVDSGFCIEGFFEDNSGREDILDPYIDCFIATKAVKRK
ncbi:MAG: class I SAM-dependent methyltransferase [Spirochaetes bacterium]|nr:class I SAM-dependent methyltransferase [Spirochaetota bacterium]